MKIGERIRQSREALGMSRPDLASASGIPYPTLAGIENTDQGSSTKLHAIAKALRVRVEWLETGKGPREAAPLGDSPSVRLDADMLAETYKACRIFADRQGRKFSMETDSARFLQVYLMRVKLPAQPSQDELIEFGASLATIMATPQGAAADGRNDGVPVIGTDEQNVAGGGRRRKA
jgi:transcriptional regulator with XRE-family HTH domain